MPMTIRQRPALPEGYYGVTPERPRRERRQQPIEFDGVHRHGCTFEIAGTGGYRRTARKLLKNRPTVENILEILRGRLPVSGQLKYIYWHQRHTWFISCSLCNTLFESQRRDDLCEECRETHTRCVWCDEYFHSDDAVYDNHSRPLCPVCYGRAVGVCVGCGYWQENLDENDRCEECADQCNRPIYNFDYRPSFNFLPVSHPASLYLGVELEVDDYPNWQERKRCSERLVELDEDEQLFYLKGDGSLNGGFEVVSHPATLEYHKAQFPWEEIIEIVKNFGGKSHNTDTCGLHIHFNSNFFGDPVDGKENDLNATKLTYIFEKFWTQVKNFSRRDDRSIEHWAGRYNGLEEYNRQLDKYTKIEIGNAEDKDIEMIKKAKGGEFDRYRAINFCNHHTIEIRIFRGTLKLETLYATLEFVDFLVRFVKKHITPYLHKLTWNSLTQQMIQDKQYKYLADYLRERRLTDVPDNS